jgi:glycerol-3-phosphate dehydrogenase
MEADYDLCIIGGGINGAGIAREAAGRGLTVLLVEAQDLGQGTSSASTKLVHGGLRYLEHGEFRLVRESLKERETLLHIAPHIVWPMAFVLPDAPGLRPNWMIAAGLFLYDHLAGRKKLFASSRVSLNDSFLGVPLQDGYAAGFQYADCWVDDARLVVLNAMDAKKWGAEILTRTACIGMSVAKNTPDWLLEKAGGGPYWFVQLKDLTSGDEFQISAKMVVNAGGPWVRGLLEASNLVREETPRVRLVKGSHIVVPRLYEGDHAFLLQQPDKRIVFVLPYEEKFSLIGTTDVPFEGDAMKPVIDLAEKEYLCAAVNRFFDCPVLQEDIVWTYSGVRALFDDGTAESQKVTRDYRLSLDQSGAAPMLSVFGGKLTTYRKLAPGKARIPAGRARNLCPAAISRGLRARHFFRERPRNMRFCPPMSSRAMPVPTARKWTC